MLDPNLASVIISALFLIVTLAITLVAITYRQKDIAALAIKALTTINNEPDQEDQSQQEQK